MRKRANFIYLNVYVQLSQHDLLNVLFFPHWMVLVLVENQLTPDVWVPFWTLNSILLVCMSILVPLLYSPAHPCFVVNLEVRKCETSFVLFFSRSFWLSWVPVLPHEFCQFVNFYNEVIWDSDRGHINVKINLGNTVILIMLSFQFMIMWCFSIYLNLFSFLSTMFYSITVQLLHFFC